MVNIRGGIITNSGPVLVSDGDVHFQTGSYTASDHSGLAAIRALHLAVEQLGMDRRQQASALSALEEAARLAEQGTPNRGRIAGAVEGAVRALEAAGVVAASTASLAPPLQQIAHWLGG